MMQIFLALVYLAAAVLGWRGNTEAAAMAAIAGAVLLLWAAERRGWSVRKPRREVDGIPVTRDVRRVLIVLFTGVDRLSLASLWDLTGVPVHRVTRVLERLEMAGWVRGAWETPEPADRPRRRFYTLTRQGHDHALQALALTKLPADPGGDQEHDGHVPSGDMVAVSVVTRTPDGGATLRRWFTFPCCAAALAADHFGEPAQEAIVSPEAAARMAAENPSGVIITTREDR